jgi:hypothetical protein
MMREGGQEVSMRVAGVVAVALLTACGGGSTRSVDAGCQAGACSGSFTGAFSAALDSCDAGAGDFGVDRISFQVDGTAAGAKLSGHVALVTGVGLPPSSTLSLALPDGGVLASPSSGDAGVSFDQSGSCCDGQSACRFHGRLRAPLYGAAGESSQLDMSF